MPTVWIRDDPKRRARFHRDPTCKQLTKKPSRGEHWELIAVDLVDAGVRPCGTCYPDAPRIKIYKRFCFLCQTRNACEHNGGVQVLDHQGRRFWVWPDTNQMPAYRARSVKSA